MPKGLGTASGQHLIYVEPSISLAAPQGADPFPGVENQDRCSIEPFNSECLWWDCLGELFDPREADNSDAADQPESAAPQAADLAGYAPQAKEVPLEMPFELEAVPGYNGSLAAPKLLDDVLAILSLNAAWFQYTFWTRQLQGIFLLRDGRFLLVGSSELQRTIDSQAEACAYRGFVANSLLSLVTFAQDPRSREILRTRLPFGQEDMAKDVKPTELTVNIPRGPALITTTERTLQNASALSCVHPSHVTRSCLAPWRWTTMGANISRPATEFELCAEGIRSDGAAPQGAVSPRLDAEYLERASQEDVRFVTSGGYHLGLRGDRWYDAEVVHVNADNTLDLKYTNPREWANRASSFSYGQGSDRNEAPIEADVAIERAKVWPKSRWYSVFQDVWEGCCGFSTVSLSFADGGGHSVRCFAHDTIQEDDKDGESKAPTGFLKLADVFADTAEAHRFRCMTLFEERVLFAGQDRQSIEEFPTVPEGGYPRGAHMALSKRLFLQLLRTSFWEKWVAQGGESPSKIAHLFKNDKFVRLVIQ